MEIESKSFSQQQLTPNTILNFPNGIPGFEKQTQFQFNQQQDSEIVFQLQSLVDDDIAFSIAHPAHFNINYHFILTDDEQATLEIQSANDLLILLILHRDENSSMPDHPTIKGSIKSPLLINTKNKIGIQKPLAAIEQSITLTEKSNEIDVSET
ncbi:MAG: flagellar assembly protein FliW [Methylococcaceae bacterium]